MKKQNWEKHESECFEYLKSKYSSDRVKFDMRGGSLSSESDIAVVVAGTPVFYIEAKMPESQCGQFVIFPDEVTRTFVYSSRNKSPRTASADAIIREMEKDFDRHRSPSTKELGLDETLYLNWIIEYYSSKGVKFVIVGNDRFIIFPIEKFGEYFDVTAVYRIKKSGSANPAKKYFEQIKGLLEYDKMRYKNLRYEGKKLYVDVCCAEDEFRKSTGDAEFCFKRDSGRRFVITKLSNTNNPNVIFSISLKKGIDPDDICCFENELKKQ